MNDRIATNLENINYLWSIHDYSFSIHDFRSRMALLGRGDQNGHTRCVAFAIGRRYLDCGDVPGLEMRLGVSFGDNPFTPEMATGFVPPPVRPGNLVFGVHLVANKDDKLTLYDQWDDAFEAGDCDNAPQAIERAQEFLESMSDEEYLRVVRSSRDQKGPLKLSNRFRLEDFEVVEGEAF